MMATPDWYAGWRHDAVHQLMAKMDDLNERYSLLKWPRWDYDLAAGTLTFSEDGAAKIVADIQVVGTTGSKDWLWAWGNDHLPKAMCKYASQTQSFGQEHGIEELIYDYVEDEDLNQLGWELTAVAARVTDAPGAYRPPDETGALFLLLTSVRSVV